MFEWDMTMTDLAKKLETSKSNLSDKMKRDNFSEKELIEIADVLNSDFKGSFIIKKRIKSKYKNTYNDNKIHLYIDLLRFKAYNIRYKT